VEESPLSSCLSASAYCTVLYCNVLCTVLYCTVLCCTVLPLPMRAVCDWKQLGAAGDAAEARAGGSPPACCCRRAGDLRCWQLTNRRTCGNACLSVKLHPMEPVTQQLVLHGHVDHALLPHAAKHFAPSSASSACRALVVGIVESDKARVARRQALLAGWLHQADDNVPSMLLLLDVAANEGAAAAWSSDHPGRMHVHPLVRWLLALVNGAPLARFCILHVKPGRMHSLPRQVPSDVATVQPLDTPNRTA